ncbi:MAG TPA: hypothetical protein VH857_10760 [Actinomycetes bacterium]|nr:hypothetical protein [Actinomycetes bacterium]
MTVKKTVTRTQLVDGVSQVEDSRDVTVDVSKTAELRGRERIKVQWSGAHPSGGRAANPYGETGLAQEYPVVLMQCRGLDDPALPAAQQMSRSTCWTSTRQERTQSATESAAVWRHDMYATDADRAQKSGATPYPDAATCQDVPFLSTHVTPFVAAKGTIYPGCTSETMPPEAAVGASYPPSELAAFTDLDGTGDANFEVRTDIENESLGCNTKTPCSLVVIPIMGISCMDGDPLCNKFGRFPPGSSNFAAEGVDDAVSPLYWWAESNWRNRISIPLTFGLPPAACDVLDDRAPTAFYGSELMSQAALQWAPAYCLRKDRFKFQLNRMSDTAAFALMDNGQAPAAMVSGRHPSDGGHPVAYAPTAVTGFSVSYVIDRPDNAGEFTDLRLTPRLLAKLLTQSYPASNLGALHPGLEKNPLAIDLDPEFQALNPGLDTIAREAAATVLALSQSSDVMSTLTSYIAQDQDAMSFIAGKPDPWGMVVNPSYKRIALPVAEWPLKDTFVPPSELECQKENPAVYLSQVAAPVSYLRTIAEAVLDAWPNVQTRCDRPTPSDPFKLGRIDRQGIGTRFMLGITSLGDAARFGLRTAALETTAGHYVGPGAASLGAAVAHASAGATGEPFRLDEAALVKDAHAYPGTMLVYTAARTSGLDKPDATKVAQFIRVATTQGQQPGPGNGQLPEGFLPIRDAGVTRPLFAAAASVADEVVAQHKPQSHRPASTGGSGSTAASGTTSPVTSSPPQASTPPLATAKPAGDPVPEAVPGAAGRSLTVEPATARSVQTPAQISRTGELLLPLLLLVGLIGGVISGGLRLGHGLRGSR